jgi:hypothetical protein
MRGQVVSDGGRPRRLKGTTYATGGKGQSVGPRRPPRLRRRRAAGRSDRRYGCCSQPHLDRRRARRGWIWRAGLGRSRAARTGDDDSGVHHEHVVVVVVVVVGGGDHRIDLGRRLVGDDADIAVILRLRLELAGDAAVVREVEGRARGRPRRVRRLLLRMRWYGQAHL